MSRSLLLLRHGKSDWEAEWDRDHDRPLAERGRAAARRMGRFLNAIGMTPDAVLSSTAVRARTTVELAGEAGGWSCPMVLSQRLYGTPPAVVLAEVAAQPADAAVLLLAGHEPTWSGLVTQLCGGNVRFPTAALACIRFDTSGWTGLAERGGELAWLVTPKLLQRAGMGE